MQCYHGLSCAIDVEVWQPQAVFRTRLVDIKLDVTSPDYLYICDITYDIHISIHKGVEKNNDGKRYFSSNWHNAAAEIVRADEGLQIPRADWQRPYRKRQTEEQSHQVKRHHTEPSCHF